MKQQTIILSSIILTLTLLVGLSPTNSKRVYGLPNPHNQQFSFNYPFVSWTIECDFGSERRIDKGLGFYHNISPTAIVADMPRDCVK